MTEYISQEIHAGYKDGLYTGRGQGFVDLVTVEVTIENQSIVSIVVDHSEHVLRIFPLIAPLLDKDTEMNIYHKVY